MAEDNTKNLLRILELVEQKNSINSLDLASELGVDHNAVIGYLKSIQARGDLIKTETESKPSTELTDEGKQIIENGSYEVLVFNYVKQNDCELREVMSNVPNAKIGVSKAMANGWLKLEKPSNKVKTTTDSVVDDVKSDLEGILNNSNSLPDSRRNDYKKRKLIKEVVLNTLNVSRGEGFSMSLDKADTELTPEMIVNGDWKSKNFKLYNFEAQGVQSPSGHLHPLLKLRDEFKDIFLEMGFSEMPTNNYIESSFWNFDALFQPQQHPARDAHDTFFLQHPPEAGQFPEDYLEKVKTVHSVGNYGSIGYKYEWLLSEAKKNLLRTHTTANSAKCLYELGKQEKFKPIKLFSIDKVFRNETLDATHLAEFNQIEGLIADYDLTLGDLIGVIHQFFNKLGIEKLQFKPAYNPYTEPSMEVFCFHPGLQKWIEVGNSGMFRPEMLLPMGLPVGVNVIAWGLSLERPAMLKFRLNNIRDLVGPKVQLRHVYDNPICRLDR